jgi:hypothetical protein
MKANKETVAEWRAEYANTGLYRLITVENNVTSGRTRATHPFIVSQYMGAIGKEPFKVSVVGIFDTIERAVSAAQGVAEFSNASFITHLKVTA